MSVIQAGEKSPTRAAHEMSPPPASTLDPVRFSPSEVSPTYLLICSLVAVIIRDGSIYRNYIAIYRRYRCYRYRI